MYLTFYKKTHNIQTINFSDITNLTEPIHTYYKCTVEIDNPTPFINLTQTQQTLIKQYEKELENAHKILTPFKDNYKTQYYAFSIPKSSGGMRTIHAPVTQFKEALTKVKNILENDIKCLPHDAAYAYVKGRSILDALKIHQNNQSNWYLKLDLTDFFDKCTPEDLYNKLINLYPFYYFSTFHKTILQQILQICSLNNGLPQGTPISPILTNLYMVDIDYKIRKKLTRLNNNHFVYTRYADDMLISCKSTFNWSEIENAIQELVTPHQIKKAKTRYGSRAGSNWNLGLMLNKDNNITLGFKRKKLLNAMLNNFCKDYKYKTRSELSHEEIEQIYSLQGQLSFLQQIEPNYAAHLLQKYANKYHMHILQQFKILLNP